MIEIKFDTSAFDELAEKFASIDFSSAVSRALNRVGGVGGTLRPSALATLRLIANSNLVGACTGRSAGLSPRRLRSTFLRERLGRLVSAGRSLRSWSGHHTQNCLCTQALTLSVN